MLEILLSGHRKNRIDLMGVLPLPLSLFGVSIGDGCIHLHGGQRGNTLYNATYYYQDLKTWHWYTAGVSDKATYINETVYANSSSGMMLYSEGGMVPSVGYGTGGWSFKSKSTDAATTYTTGDTLAGTRSQKRSVLAPDGATLYFMGGFNPSISKTTNQVTTCILGQTPFKALAPLPRSVNGHTVGWYNGKIYVGGGWSDDNSANQTAVYEYNPSTNIWVKITDIPQATSWGDGCVYKNLFVVALPADASGKYSLGIYNIDKGTWKVKPTGLLGRIGARYIADPTINKGIILMGGMQNGQYVGGPNWEVTPRFDAQYLINEDWLLY